MPLILMIIVLASAVALHFLTGSIPVSFFAFPLNLILAIVWALIIFFSWRNRRKSAFVEFMLSRGATIWAIVLFLVYSLVVGITGMRSLAHSWIFAYIILFLLTVLMFVILRGWRAPTATGARLGAVRWRFVLNHLGLLVALSSAFWGAPDSQEFRLYAMPCIPVDEVFRADGTSSRLGYDLELKDFRIETYSNGTPSMYEADVIIDGEPVVLRVNEPYCKSFAEDVYLAGFDGPDGGGCILQVTREPWKYPALAGIIMMLAGAFLLFAGGPRRRYDDND